MNEDRWGRVKELLDEALDLPPSERPAFLDGACGADRELRAELDSLLASHDEAPDVWETALLARPAPEDPQALVGEEVGPWRLEAFLRAGGTSHVYRAVRVRGDGPRVAAVKVLRPGHDTADLLARFARERRILAHLRHPTIVRLYDADVVAGRPCLIMEHVEGLPIDRHVEERSATPGAVVELLARVCDAVQHAHRSLVVHRDLKPGNLLVTDEGEPKVLDFGVVKLLRPGEDTDPDTDEALARPDDPTTVRGLAPLTPRYASPEQLRGDPISAASDVYALGVLLEELLARFRLPVSHDLTAIARKARAEDPDERYGTAAALAEDLRRTLAGEPVRARRATLSYRTRRFLGRHPWSSATTAVLLVLLLASLVTLDGQRDRAVAAEGIAWRAHGQALAVSSFYSRLLEAADPVRLTADPGFLEALHEATASAGETFAGRPEAEGRVRTSLARLLAHLGRHAEAVAQAERALEVARGVPGFGSKELAAMEEELRELRAVLDGDRTARREAR